MSASHLSTQARASLALLSTSVALSDFERAKKSAVAAPFPHRLQLAALLGKTAFSPADDRTLLLDVRSPCEFARGHIPGATSLPLFTDDERAEVGTLYSTRGHDVAVARGCEIVDRSWRSLFERLPPTLSDGDDVLVYCKRGGMRSGGVSWLLSQAPLQVSVLDGGYQVFRHWVLETFERDERPLVVVGGRTGSGKTDVLLAMRDQLGAQVLDLEGDAHHRGSSFGALGRPPQPTTEHYENLLAVQWAAFTPDAPVFVEDEGAHVGSCGVPRGLWARMRADDSRVLRLEVPHKTRVERLVREYGAHSTAELSRCVRALEKRLGSADADRLCSLLEADPPRLAEVADSLLLGYYDATYDRAASKRPGSVSVLAVDTSDALSAGECILSEVLARGRE